MVLFADRLVDLIAQLGHDPGSPQQCRPGLGRSLTNLRGN